MNEAMNIGKPIRKKMLPFAALVAMAVPLVVVACGGRGSDYLAAQTSLADNVPALAEATAVSSTINVGGWTDSPQISPDGKRLYFMYAPLDFEAISGRQEIKRGGPSRPGATTTGDAPEELINFDIYEATRARDGSWTVAGIDAINTPDHLEICPSITFSARRLYFVRSRIAEGAKASVYVSQWSGGRWGKPRQTKVPVGSSCDISFSANEKEVFLDDDPAGGEAVPTEIRYARQIGGGGWSSQRKLSRSVNTPTEWEGGPWLSKDGKRLYFDRSRGLKDVRVMVARRRTTRGFGRPRRLPLEGFPNAPATGEPITGVPSLTADEKTIYLIVVNGHTVPEIWFARRRTDGSWESAQAVD